MVTLKRKCKHHGLTEFYHYTNNNPDRCKDCTRESRRARYARDPLYDRKYTVEWNKANPGKVKTYNRDSARRYKRAQTKKFSEFFTLNFKTIITACTVFDINPFSLKMVLAPTDNFKTKEDIINRLAVRKRSEMLTKETWKQSTLLKYHLGMREDYSSRTEEEKEMVRTLSKENAAKIVNTKIKLMLEKLKP